MAGLPSRRIVGEGRAIDCDGWTIYVESAPDIILSYVVADVGSLINEQVHICCDSPTECGCVIAADATCMDCCVRNRCRREGRDSAAIVCAIIENLSVVHFHVSVG